MKIKEYIRTCTACPVQYEGIIEFDNGEFGTFYARQRHGSCRIDIAFPNGNKVFGAYEGDGDGWSILEIISACTSDIDYDQESREISSFEEYNQILKSTITNETIHSAHF